MDAIILTFIWKCGGTRIAKTTWKRKINVGWISLSGFKIYLQAHMGDILGLGSDHLNEFKYHKKPSQNELFGFPVCMEFLFTLHGSVWSV